MSDLLGNDIVEFESTFTIRDEPIRTSALEITFDEASKTELMDVENTTASWNEFVADALAALFTAAGGNGTAGDLTPTANINLTPDYFVRGVSVITEHGIEYDVYNFRSVSIPRDVTVRFSQRAGGPNRPVKIVSLKDILIEGTLTVSGGVGGAGEGTNYTTSKIPLAKGGEGGPGGGRGSDNDTTAKVLKDAVDMDAEDVLYGGGGGKGGDPPPFVKRLFGNSGGGGEPVDS